MTLAANITKVKSRISAAAANAARSHDSITLLAVSKTRSADLVRQAYLEGLSEFGENYLQEALEKIEALRDLPITWHFIGPIQSNKTKEIATHFDWVHSLDRLKTAKRLNDSRSGSPIDVCIQVNISNETTKSGCSAVDAKTLADAIATLPQLRLRGLMAIPAASDAINQQRQAFAKLRQLFVEIKCDHPYIDTLSMGMSADMAAAIAEGATIVRIGTDIFGPRAPNTPKSLNQG